MIVDSQVHIWAEDGPDRAWPGIDPSQRPGPHRAQPITAESLQRDMSGAGVDRVILVPPSWEGDRNDIVLDAVRRYPEQFRFIGRLDISAANAGDWVRNWRLQPGMLGLQLTFQTPLFQRPLIDGEVDWLWSKAEAVGLPLTIYIPLALMPIIDKVATRHPGLKIVINHFGLAGHQRDAEAFEHFEQLLTLHRHRNIAVKASCLPFYTSQSYPFPLLHEPIRRVIDAFGPQRVFWGSDLSRLPCSYREGVTLFTDEFDWHSADEQAWVMGRGVCQWLGWVDDAVRQSAVTDAVR